MKEAIGLWFIVTGLIFGCITLFGMELSLKEKVKTGLSMELFVTLMIVGSYLLE